MTTRRTTELLQARADVARPACDTVASRQTTFVLVHGAWAGAWGWSRVAERLRSRGHRVHAPALSGLGERSHLQGRAIDLSTHIDDIVNEILWNDLDDVVLAGHSYAGFVITGVVERIPERVASIVYVEAFIPEDGQSFADLATWLDTSQPMVPAPATANGDYRTEADRAWVDGKATPQPIGTFTQPLRVSGAYQAVAKKAFVQATGWDGPFAASLDMARSEPGWQAYQVDGGHDLPIDRPNELAMILEACA
jgi:pimeloyl-ACP methyl ester carboxylesterase